MQVKPNEAVAAQYAIIVEEFFEDGLSLSALSNKYGPSVASINKHLQRYQMQHTAEYGAPRERKKTPVDPRAFSEKKALSFRHATIAFQITRYMTDNKLSPTTFGMMIHKSRIAVRLMEKGAHDFTICEIEKIAEVLGMTFDQLMYPKQKAA